MDNSEKTKKLHRILSEYKRVGVAFSGGVDSSFLLKSAFDVLGPKNVVVVHGRSCLQKKEEQERAETWLSRHGYSAEIKQLVIDLQPLAWKGMTANNKDRCYRCKNRMYTLFLKELADNNISFLLDGTNTDDLKQDRPGLQAILELGVQTPLASAGLAKAEIRFLSSKLHLDTSDQPSSSCLATRLPYGLIITEDRLNKVALWEEGLAQMGFIGCRARMDVHSAGIVYLQVIRADIERVFNPGEQGAIQAFFKECGIEQVLINPQCR